MQHIEQCRCIQCHQKAIEELLKYFTSGTEFEVSKATIKIEAIKDIFGNLFPNYEWTTGEQNGKQN